MSDHPGSGRLDVQRPPARLTTSCRLASYLTSSPLPRGVQAGRPRAADGGPPVPIEPLPKWASNAPGDNFMWGGSTARPPAGGSTRQGRVPAGQLPKTFAFLIMKAPQLFEAERKGGGASLWVGGSLQLKGLKDTKRAT